MGRSDELLEVMAANDQTQVLDTLFDRLKTLETISGQLEREVGLVRIWIDNLKQKYQANANSPDLKHSIEYSIDFFRSEVLKAIGVYARNYERQLGVIEKSLKDLK